LNSTRFEIKGGQVVELIICRLNRNFKLILTLA